MIDYMAETKRLTKVQYITIISLLLIIFSIPFLIPLFKLMLSTQTSADPNKIPQEIVVSNITSSSVYITWFTINDTEGFVKYGTSSDALNFLGSDIRDVGKDEVSRYKTHIVKLENLSPNTKYFFAVYSDGEVEDDQTQEFKTFGVDENVALPETLKGKLNEPVSNALVYVFASNGRATSEVRSTYTSSNGTFTYDISSLKTSDGASLFPLENAKLVTYVNAVDKGRARVIHPPSDDPGTVTLDTNSNIAFDLNVDINESDSTAEDISTQPPQESSNPLQTQEVNYGINLMNDIFNSNMATSNPFTPTNIFVSNVTQTSFTVNWITKQPTSGYIIYGTSAYSLKSKAIDIRGGQEDKTRYTHSVAITSSSRNAGDAIYFKIVANGKSFGQNNGNTAYKFIAPESLSSPPSPKSLNGKLDLLEGSLLNENSRDYLIFGKVTDENGQTSIYLSTTPAFNSNGWTMMVGDAKSGDLKSAIDFSSIELYVVGEYNSTASLNANSLEETATISLVPGLSIINPMHDQSYTNLESVTGTATPNSDVTIRLGGQLLHTTSDAYGNWSIAVSQITAKEYELTVESLGKVLGLNFDIGLNQLPITSLDKSIFPQILGITSLLLGLLTIFYVKKHKLE